MCQDQKSNDRLPRVQEIEGVLRYPDGSADIAAYSKLAHRERDAAVAALAREAIRRAREMWSAVWTSLAPIARSEPPSEKHHAAARR